MGKNRSRKTANNSDAGFTLLEVVLSIGVLAVVSLPLLYYFSESLQYSSMVSKEQQAAFLAQEVTEGLLSQKTLVSNVDELTNTEGDTISINGYTVPSLVENGYTQVEGDTFLAIGSGEGVFTKTEKSDDGIDLYDVEVTITAPDDETMKKVNELDYYLQDISGYGVNSDTDVMYAGITESNRAVFELMGVHFNYLTNHLDEWEGDSVDEDYIKKNMTREIYVDLYMAPNEDDASKSDYRVAIYHVYSCPGIKGDSRADSTWSTGYLVDTPLTDLRNIYLLTDWCENGDTVYIRDLESPGDPEHPEYEEPYDPDSPKYVEPGEVANRLQMNGHKLGLNIIYQQEVADPEAGGDPEEGGVPKSGEYVLLVNRDGFEGRLSVYTNVEEFFKDSAWSGIMKGTYKYPLNEHEEKTMVGTFLGDGKPTLGYTVCTRIYPAGHESDVEPIVELVTTKGE